MRPRQRCHAACLLCLALLAAALPAVHAAEAVRYRDAQGIDIISGRSAAAPTPPLPASALVSATAVPASTPTSASTAMSANTPAPATRPAFAQPRSAQWQISRQEQQARDRDRLTILREELANELSAMQAHVSHSSRLDGEARQRARDQLHRHQGNVRDLHREIQRAATATK